MPIVRPLLVAGCLAATQVPVHAAQVDEVCDGLRRYFTIGALPIIVLAYVVARWRRSTRWGRSWSRGRGGSTPTA